MSDNYYEDTATTARTNINTSDYAQFSGSQGWICPKCGRVNAPWVMACPCSETKTYTTTWATTGVPSACAQCKNNPNNGGSGVCHCTLGTQTIY